MSDFKYPPGVRPFAQNERKSPTSKKKRNLKIAAGNRGMDFESGINETNLYYAEKGLCCITKRPTPINVVKVDYSKGATITQAYFETQSTTAERLAPGGSIDILKRRRKRYREQGLEKEQRKRPFLLGTVFNRRCSLLLCEKKKSTRSHFRSAEGATFGS